MLKTSSLNTSCMNVLMTPFIFLYSAVISIKTLGSPYKCLKIEKINITQSFFKLEASGFEVDLESPQPYLKKCRDSLKNLKIGKIEKMAITQFFFS